SAIVLVLGVGSFFHGFREGVEFSGGRSYVINFGRPAPPGGIRTALEKTLTGTSPEIKLYGSPEQLEITTDYLIHESGNGVDSAVLSKLYAGLQPFLPTGTAYRDFASTKFVKQSVKVEPTISDELKTGAFK